MKKDEIKQSPSTVAFYISSVQSYLRLIPRASHNRQQNPTTTPQIKAILIII